MSTRLLEFDPVTRTRSVFHYDNQDETFVISTEQDVAEIVDDNKALANQHDGNWRGDMHRVASIPLSVWQELQRKGIAKDKAALRRWLNDSDNRCFRTRPGTV